GTARPFLAVDHAGLYRNRQRTLARSVPPGPSTKLTRLQHRPVISCCLLRDTALFGHRGHESPRAGGIMSAHESMEHAEHAEHASGHNKGIALLISIIALCLALSETLGKGAQTEAISRSVEASNLWAFFQAKSIRRTVVQTAAEQGKFSLGATGDEA